MKELNNFFKKIINKNDEYWHIIKRFDIIKFQKPKSFKKNGFDSYGQEPDGKPYYSFLNNFDDVTIEEKHVFDPTEKKILFYERDTSNRMLIPTDSITDDSWEFVKDEYFLDNLEDYLEFRFNSLTILIIEKLHALEGHGQKVLLKQYIDFLNKMESRFDNHKYEVDDKENAKKNLIVEKIIRLREDLEQFEVNSSVSMNTGGKLKNKIKLNLNRAASAVFFKALKEADIIWNGTTDYELEKLISENFVSENYQEFKDLKQEFSKLKNQDISPNKSISTLIQKLEKIKIDGFPKS